ncbi:hypothetical protein B6U99_05000 [Candidatus Geothermarchaeota archaeon ex4572_27]|nr:MAG: hypothetical protein B6U99_05000 [Candidatus Geothermarchaeota archaeon ex4572_27]
MKGLKVPRLKLFGQEVELYELLPLPIPLPPLPIATLRVLGLRPKGGSWEAWLMERMRRAGVGEEEARRVIESIKAELGG